MIVAGWIAAGLLLWAAVFGTGLWCIVRRLEHTRRWPATVPSPLGVLEQQWAAGRLSRRQFASAVATLRRYGIDR